MQKEDDEKPIIFLNNGSKNQISQKIIASHQKYIQSKKHYPQESDSKAARNNFNDKRESFM